MKKKNTTKVKALPRDTMRLIDEIAEEQAEVIDALGQLQKIVCDLRKDLKKVTEQILSLR